MRLLLIFIYTLTLNAQNLRIIVEEIISTNPIISERLKNYNSLKEDITEAKSGFYPKLDLSIGIGYENNTKKDKLTQDKTHYDFNVYKNSLTYTQNFFNGFKTTQQVEEKKFKTILAAYSYVEKVNNTVLDAVDVYLKLMKNVELLNNEQENIKINEKILNKVQKLYNAGLTTLSEVNKIEASLALANSNYVTQENILLDSKYNMHRILGRYIDIEKLDRPIFNTKLPTNIEEISNLSIQNNPSLLVAKYNIKLAQATYEEEKSSFYPSIDIEISQSINKNLGGIEGEEEEFRAMAYLKYNIFNGFADKSSLQKSLSEIQKEVHGEDILIRKVTEGLNLSFISYNKLNEKLKYLKQYKNFAKKTLTLYSKEYTIGRRSLLDLLSAQNDFIKSKSQVIDTEYNILFARSKILDTMGILVSTILKGDNPTYSNVELNDNIIIDNAYPLPISYYINNNLVPDDKDIRNNSIELITQEIDNCQKEISNIQKEEVHKSFLFRTKDYKPTGWTIKKLDIMINSLKSYGFKYIKFTIISNVYYKNMDKEKLYELSEKRAQSIKNILINNGIDITNINMILYNNAPTISDESDKPKLLNNRVDIVVKKLRK